MQRLATLLVCVWGTIAAAAVSAQTLQYPIDPDRPDLTNTAHLVEPGFVQFEVGGLYVQESASHQGYASPIGVRIGLNDWIEARFAFDGAVGVSAEDGPQSGIGNIQLGTKLRLWPDQGGRSLLSVLPTVTIPTASQEKGLGSGGRDLTVAALTAIALSPRWQLGVNYIIGTIAAAGGTSHFAQHLVSASLGLAASRWNPYVEGIVLSRNRPDGTPLVSINTGGLYMMSPRLALDGGLQFGLTEEAPAVAVFAGFSLAMNVHGFSTQPDRRAGRDPISPPAVQVVRRRVE